jgi:hypothetical protein
LFRRQKNQSETMSAIPAPTDPPTMAPKLGVVEGVVVAVGNGGVLVEWDKLEVGGVGVPEVTETVIVSMEELLDTVEDVPEADVLVLGGVGVPEVTETALESGIEELLDTMEDLCLQLTSVRKRWSEDQAYS